MRSEPVAQQLDRAVWLAGATRRLKDAGCDTGPGEAPRRSAELILREVLGLDRLALVRDPQAALPEAALPKLEALLRRRLAGEPMAYLLGRREFYGREFGVSPATLIPRPESEHLIEAALTLAPQRALRFADLGTGSGCLALSLCLERPLWQGVAVDLSGAALAVAAANAARHGLTAPAISLIQADFTRPLFADGGLDLLVSNPPYVSLAEHQTLAPGVRDFEPLCALVPQGFVGAPDGLEALRCLLEVAARALKPGGLLLMEHGCGQGAALRGLLENNNWEKPCICKDLSGHDRYIRAWRNCGEKATVS